MKKYLILLLSMIAGLFIASAKADDGTSVTGEKGLFTVLTSDTVPDGKISFGINHNNIDRDPLDVDVSYYSVTFGYGITDNLEFVVMVSPFTVYDIDPKFGVDPGDTVNGKQVDPIVTGRGAEGRDGFGDIQVGAKYVFVRSGDNGVGLRGFVKIPTGDDKEGVGTGKPDFGADLVASGIVGDALEVAGNVGFTIRGDADFRNADGDEAGGKAEIGNGIRWGGGAAFPARGVVQGVVELNGEFLSEDAEYDDWADLTGGLRFHCGDFFFSLGARYNLKAKNDNHQNPWGGVVILSYAPGRARGGDVVPPPPPPTAPPPAPPPPLGYQPPIPEFVWPEVYFPFDQYVLTAQTREKLDQVATYMTDNPNIKVTVEGHCCYIGTDEYNLALGQNRADAIKDYLVSKGISGDRLRTVSYGEAKPKYDNSKEITRQYNRRGFFVVIKPD